MSSQSKIDEVENERRRADPEADALPAYSASPPEAPPDDIDHPDIEAPLYEEVVDQALPAGPISLTLENGDIYASLMPTVPFYRVPRRMVTSARILLERCIPATPKPGGGMRKARTLSLYESMGIPATRDIEIKGLKRECFPSATIKRRNSLFGAIWEVLAAGEVVLSFHRDRRWKDGSKAVVAEEGKFRAAGKHFMEIRADIDPRMRDLIVACWCARLCREASVSQWASPLGQVLVASGASYDKK